jgi:hypothetical protein
MRVDIAEVRRTVDIGFDMLIIEWLQLKGLDRDETLFLPPS